MDTFSVRLFVTAALLSYFCLCVYSIPIEYKWKSEWDLIAKINSIHPNLRSRKLSIDIGRLSNDYQVGIRDIYDNVIGIITVSPNGQNVVGFKAFSSYHETRGEYPFDTAKTNASAFLPLFENAISRPQKYGNREVVSDGIFTDEGRYKISFRYIYKQIIVREIIFEVDNDGYIASLSDYDVIRNLRYVNPDIQIDQVISDAPSVTSVTDNIDKYLRLNKYEKYTLTGLKRVGVMSNGKLYINWTCSVSYDENKRATILYNESSSNCTVFDYAKQTIQPTVIQNQLRCLNPIFFKTNSDYICSSSARWKHLPIWNTRAPNSLLVVTDKAGPQLYRPLPDIESLRNTYQYPSISHNKVWLSFSVNNGIISFVNLKSNNIYCLPNTHAIDHRISWSCDDLKCLLVDRNNSKMYVFDAPITGSDLGEEHELRFNELPLCAEFSRTNPNEIYALSYSEKTGQVGKWHIVSIQIKSQSISITSLIDFSSQPLSFHVCKHGDSIWVLCIDSMVCYDINTKISHKVDYLKNGRTVLGNSTIDYSCFDWDTSDDGTKVIFTAKKSDGSMPIYVADYNGNNVKLIYGDWSDDLPRYFLNDKFPFVNINTIPYSIVEKLKYIHQPISWQNLLPFGPWDRAN